jgi:fatty-acyl-CoA synthase/long-chain acyl-CoA synthetase
VQVDHLTQHAENAGDRIAVIDDRGKSKPRRLSYIAFNDDVNALANGFLSLGSGEGSHIAWWGNNSIEILTAIHAIRKCGGVSIPIPYKSTSDEALYLLHVADVEILFIESQYLPVLAPIRDQLKNLKHIVSFGDDHTIGRSIPMGEVLGSSAMPVTEGNYASTQQMIFTSGTTGKPKGAIRKVGGEANQFGPLFKLIGWDQMDQLIYLTTGPLYHSGPLGFTLRSQLVGSTVVTQHSFDAEDWLRLVEAHQVTSTFSAPTPMRRITALPDEIKAQYDVSSLACFIANAAPWTMKLKRAYLNDFRADSLWEIYGSTELSVCTVLAPEDQLRKPGSCGVPAPGVSIKLFDDDGIEISEPDVPGELYAKSLAVFDTYYKSHHQYLEDHRDGYQTVGDIAYVDDEGYYFICDRKKDMIITGGVNVYPAEIENVLDDHPQIAEVAVFGIPDEEWGEAVCAIIVPLEGLEENNITEFARNRLSGPKVPKQIFFYPELPKTGSGKVLKRDIREQILKNL